MAARKKPASVPKEVFLSHSHKDKKALLRLAEELRRHGVRVWFSERGITGAQQWLDEIGAALKRCDSFIVLLTPAAVASEWVKHEVTFALGAPRYRGRLIPILLKDCDYEDLAWPLANLQIIGFPHFTRGVEELLRVWGLKYKKTG
jgi:TIR domain